MRKDGPFGDPADSALFVGALVLCLAVALHRAARLRARRFGAAAATLWLIALAALPIPLYFSAGIGLWAGAILFEGVGLPANIGAAAGLVLPPPTLLSLALSILGSVFTAVQER